MSIAEKLVKVAENQQKIFDSGVLSAYQLKGTASGEVVSISDVAPVEHNMAVKLSSDTITDFSTVKLDALGKNLINFFDVNTQVDNIKYINTSNNKEYTVKGYLIDKLEVGKSYTLSYSFKNNDNIMEYMGFVKRNKNTTIGTLNYLITTTVNKDVHTFIAEQDCDYIVYKVQSTITQEQIDKFSTFQLELGDKTPYEPYKGTTYTPYADGTVANVKSIYPTTTLMTDTSGVLTQCEYYQDARKVKQDLTDLIISLGGEI